MSNAMREAFERQFPKPQGVIFDERRRFYISGLDGENGVTKHNARWQGWQAALEHAGRGGDKSGAWQFFKDGEWHVGINQFNHRGNTEAAGYPVRDLYTHPPAPVVPCLNSMIQWSKGWREFDSAESWTTEDRILYGASRCIHEAMLNANPEPPHDQ